MRTHERILGTGAANTLSLLCDPRTSRGAHFGDPTRQLYDYNAGEESMAEEAKDDWDPHGLELDDTYFLNLTLIRRESARALANLSTRYESQPAVVEGKGVIGLVKCLKDEVRRALLTVVASMSPHVPSLCISPTDTHNLAHAQLSPHSHTCTPPAHFVFPFPPSLVRCWYRGRRFHTCRHVLTLQDVHVRHFGTLGLVNLTNRPTFHPPVVDYNGIDALAVVADRSDVLPKRYACLALGNLAVTGLYNNKYVSSGAVPVLVAALDAENEVETRFNAAYAIAKLAHDPGMHEVRRRGCAVWCVLV